MLQAVSSQKTGSLEPITGRDSGPPPGFAQSLAAEVAKSRPDAMSGEGVAHARAEQGSALAAQPAAANRSATPCIAGTLRCMACGKQFPDSARLAQHLQDKHGGLNEPGAVSRAEQAQAGGGARPAGLTLADMMVLRPMCVAAPCEA